MTTIAFLACHDTLPGAPGRRPDAFEHDHQVAALRAGLADTGIAVAELDWRAPLATLVQHPLVLLGTAWDYQDRPGEFLERLDALEARGVIVANDAATVRWNFDKGYLRELAERGAPAIPTVWLDAPDGAAVRAACVTLGAERVVVKRRVGAGAEGQHLFAADDPALATWRMDRPALVQPFLPAIASEGEYSFVFIDGAFSHAIRKTAAAGDYRIQSLYGGREAAHDPAPEDRAAAAAILAALPFPAPLYARIDMVRRPDGVLAVIEAELIEPYLYPLQGPELGPRLARAISARLGR